LYTTNDLNGDDLSAYGLRYIFSIKQKSKKGGLCFNDLNNHACNDNACTLHAYTLYSYSKFPTVWVDIILFILICREFCVDKSGKIVYYNRSDKADHWKKVVDCN